MFFGRGRIIAQEVNITDPIKSCLRSVTGVSRIPALSNRHLQRGSVEAIDRNITKRRKRGKKEGKKESEGDLISSLAAASPPTQLDLTLKSNEI